MKDKIFISHANPEDNYFAAWLASKLNVLGYNAWVDVEDFFVGDAFFTTIEPIIREQAIKFIAVNSEAYIAKSRNQNTGVSRELNTAITVRGEENFILPIRIDAVSYNDFPTHYASWNSIDFNENWQIGLIALIKQLEKMNVPKIDSINNPTEIWFKAIKNENKVIDKKESYYSNWFAFDLPNKIFIHRPENLEKEKLYTFAYPYILEANHIITFASESTFENEFVLGDSKCYDTAALQNLNELEVSKAFTLIEPKKKLVRLLNQCFRLHLIKNDLSYWKKRNLNYFKNDGVNSKAVSLKKRYGKGSRALVGKKSTKIRGKSVVVNWHYAINARVELSPFPYYKIFYTLVFTNNEGRGLGKKNSAALRRSVPADWYNRKWFEMLLAAMLRLSNNPESKSLSIEIDSDKNLIIENLPVGGTIDRGYKEPAKNV